MTTVIGASSWLLLLLETVARPSVNHVPLSQISEILQDNSVLDQKTRWSRLGGLSNHEFTRSRLPGGKILTTATMEVRVTIATSTTITKTKGSNNNSSHSNKIARTMT